MPEGSASGLASSNPRHDGATLLIASGSTDGEIKVWDFETRRVVANLNKPHRSEGILRLEYIASAGSKDILVSQGRDGRVCGWNLQAILTIAAAQDSFQSHGGSGPHIDCSGFFAEADCRVLLFSLNVGSYTFAQFALAPDVTRCNFAVCPAQNDQFFEVWDLSQQNAVSASCVTRKIGGKTGMVMCLKCFNLNPGSEAEILEFAVMVGVESGEVGLFASSGLLSPAITAEVEKNNQRKCSAEEAESGVGDDANDGSVHFASSRLALTGDDASWLSVHEEPVLCMDVATKPNSAGDFLGISGSAEAKIGMFTVSKTGRVTLQEPLDVPKRGISDIRIRADCRIFVTAGWDFRVRVFDLKKRRPLANLLIHTGSVHVLALPPRGLLSHDDVENQDRQLWEDGYFCSGSQDARIAMWNLYPVKTKAKHKVRI